MKKVCRMELDIISRIQEVVEQAKTKSEDIEEKNNLVFVQGYLTGLKYRMQYDMKNEMEAGQNVLSSHY